MSLSYIIMCQSVIMLLLILTGVICFRTGIISKNTGKELSALVLKIVNPAVILSSFMIEFKSSLIKNLIIAEILSIAAYLIMMLISYTVLRNKNNSRKDIDIERFSCIYSNCGFMGIPLVNALFGDEGVFYLTAFIATFNLIVWTHGLIQISGVRDFKSIKKALLSPAVISIVLGLVIFLAQIKLPEIICTAIKDIGNMNTPLAMITAGITIAQTDILKALKKTRIYFIAFIKLILIPMVLILAMKPLHIDEIVTMTVIIAAAAPSAAMCTLFALQYNKNSLYASEIFAITTILSIATIPLTVIAYGLLPL